jgi:glycosyltransferase involved in cell wall biosynthesis
MFRDKSRGFGGPIQWLVLGIRLVLAYIVLVTRLLANIRGCQAVAIGYIGQLDMLILGALARLCGKPVLFNPLVTLTDTVLEDREIVSAQGLIARLIYIADWLALRIATVTIVDTEANAEYLVDRFGLERSRIEVLYVGADEGIFRCSTRQHAGGRINVLFYGKMIPLHGIETILETVLVLHRAGETDISFEVIGSGQQEQLVHNFIREYPDLPITYRDWVAYRRLPQRIASADVVLGIFGTTTKAGRVIPNKVFQAMAVGAPIITRNSQAVRTVLRDRESALLVEPGEPEQLASAILELRGPELRMRLAHGASEAFDRTGSDEAGMAHLTSILARHFPGLLTQDRQGRCS